MQAEGGARGYAERFVYFVIRIRRDANGPDGGLAGTLERLGSGRARRFDGARELLEMLAERADEAGHR